MLLLPGLEAGRVGGHVSGEGQGSRGGRLGMGVWRLLLVPWSEAGRVGAQMIGKCRILVSRSAKLRQVTGLDVISEW